MICTSRPIRAVICALFAVAMLAACAISPKSPFETGGPEDAPIVILIGVDGLRADVLTEFPEATANMRALAADGVRASAMIPAMPSVTFVNFYTLATGLYPDRHGIVSNASYSRSLGRIMARTEHGRSEWWGGEPIWATAEKAGVKTATMFWLGSEAEIAGVRPDRWLPYQHEKPYDERVSEVLDWLDTPESDRPRLVTLYFHSVDTAGHIFGPKSAQERAAIADVDEQIGALMAGVEELGLGKRVHYILVSDHGMAPVPAGNVINLDRYISFDDVLIPKFEGPDGPGRGPLVHIFVERGDVDDVYDALAKGADGAPFSVYRREQLPARWRLNHPDRTGDIVAVAEPGWLLFGAGLKARYPMSPRGGSHGYDRHHPSMRATFIAKGARFPKGRIVEPFANVEVYGLIADLLGIEPAPTDGDISKMRHILPVNAPAE